MEVDKGIVTENEPSAPSRRAMGEQWSPTALSILRIRLLWRTGSRGPSNFFGATRRAYSAVVADKATKAGSMSSFAKASEDTRCAFLHGLTAVASCVGG